MKHANEMDENFSNRCRKSYDKVVAQLKKVRKTVFGQFQEALAGHQKALRLALNEAEALAWETPYPHLVFADLAEEKARALAAWSDRQRAIRR
jgi:hypothetical protein